MPVSVATLFKKAPGPVYNIVMSIVSFKLVKTRLVSISFFVLASVVVQSAHGSHTCSRNDSAKQCMVCNCFFEASTEPEQGKMAVNVVVISRANDEDSAGAFCRIVFAEGQFSWVQHHSRVLSNKDLSSPNYKQCEATANSAIAYFSNSTNPYSYYNPEGCTTPKWAKDGSFKFAYKIGNHRFYNKPNLPAIRAPGWMNNLSTYVKKYVPNGMISGGASQ